MDNPETFEYKMRESSNIWPKPSLDDIFLQHEKEDVWNKDLDIEDRPKFKALPNATHYIVVN